MMAIAAFVLPLVFGWLVARSLLGFRPRWALHATCAALAAGLGGGWASISFFLLRWAGLASPAVLVGVDIIAVGVAVLLFRRRPPLEDEPGLPPFPWTWLAWSALGLTLALCLAGFAAAWSGNPHGDYDAFSIWNLRAQWLASDSTWRYAVAPSVNAPLYGAVHTGYPLLLSGWIAHVWTASATTNPAVPMLIALLFALAVPALLAGILAAARSPVVGLMAAALLLSADVYVQQGPKQYADVPLSFYLLAALALVAWRECDPKGLALAGLCAGLALWTKTEGLPFVVALAAVVAWRRCVPFLLGVAPGVLTLIAFKLALAPPGTEVPLPSTLAGVIEKISQPGRWWAPIVGFAQPEWLLPIGAIAVAGWALKVNRDPRARLLIVPVAVLQLAAYLVLVLTTNDQKWHIETAASRLVAQVWPAGLFVAFYAMGRPEDFAVAIKAGKKPR